MYLIFEIYKHSSKTKYCHIATRIFATCFNFLIRMQKGALDILIPLCN